MLADYSAKAIFILGLTNIFELLLIYLTCRCGFGGLLFRKYAASPRMRKWYALHGYFWWFFFFSVIAHSVLAVWVYGIPF